MVLGRFFLISLPLVMLLAASTAAHARLLYESAHIALYSAEAEPGKRNSHHPITLEADQLSAALSRVQARSGETGEVIDLFPEKNRKELAKRLAKELRSLSPNQELHLVSFRHIGTFFSGQRNASAARTFMESGRLNLIFGQIDLFFSEFRDPDRPIPPMGSRKRAASLKGRIIPTGGVSFVDGRNDWVALDLDRVEPLLPAVAPSVDGAGEAPGAKSPKAVIVPQEKSIEEKLKILKNLRNRELITEQEYVEKKRQILDDL